MYHELVFKKYTLAMTFGSFSLFFDSSKNSEDSFCKIIQVYIIHPGCRMRSTFCGKSCWC